MRMKTNMIIKIPNRPDVEINLADYSDGHLLRQRRTAIFLQERLMELFEKSPEEMNNSQLPDWNNLCEQISEMERELEERGYFENPDTNEYLKEDSDG